MKILMVEPYAHASGHFSQYLSNLYEAHKVNGNEVDILTFSSIQGQRDNLSSNYQVISEDTLQRINKRLGTTRSSRIFEYITLMVTYLKLAWIANRKNYEYIEITTTFLNPLSPLLLTIACLSKVTTVIHLHIGPYNHGEHVQNIIFKKIVELSYRLATTRNKIKFICLSATHLEQFKEWIPRVFKKTIHYIPHGIRLQENQIKPKRTNIIPHFLHFGVNHSRKEYSTIFKAFSSIKTPYKLTFAGKIYDDVPENDPRILAKQHNIPQLEIINKFFTEREKGTIINTCDAMILSYTTDNAGTSGVLTDAAAYAIPIIISDSQNSINQYNLGLTFKAEDPEDLRKRIIEFIQMSEQEISKIRTNLVKYAKNNSWENFAAQTSKLLFTN
jgi:glycosyltransferase involved in cell wall biosynthesis